MRVQLPKPIHGWRAFAGEVGIIVLGVLIALAAGQVVEVLHDQQLAAEARENVREEAATNVGSIRDRLNTQDCIDRRLGELQDILSRSGEGPLVQQPTWVSRPPTWPMFSGRWQAATASGRNSLFSSDEQGRFSVLYRVFAEFDSGQAREQEIWSQLRALEWWQGPLGPQARLDFAKALQQAKFISWDLRYGGTYVIHGAAEMGLPNRPPPQTAHPICLPIITRRSDAVKELKAPFGEP